jgi:glycosyltransferase involved in cell wall biosynthesis
MALEPFRAVTNRADGQAEDGKARRKPRRVLMLAYFFPPDASGGVPRTVKFIKYLDRLDWKCTVIAPEWGSDRPDGEIGGFAASIPPDTEIIRVGVGGSDHGSTWTAFRRLPLLWRIEGMTRRLSEFPDEFTGWSRQVLPVAKRILSARHYDVIYSTSPPVTSHAIALRLTTEFGVPWVADFRDPWTDNSIAYGRPPHWRRQLDLRLERRICSTANRVIANTATNRATLVAKHDVAPEKIMTITNGYDEEDFEGVDGRPPNDRFRISYIGSFYSTYNPTAFLMALKQFLLQEPSARVVLTLAGGSCEWAAKHIDDPNLVARLELLGQLPHRNVFSLLAASHLLLHTYPQGIPYSVPGKLYEYLRSGRPIVAICDRPSEVASILERTRRGRAFRPNEVEELAGYLRSEYQRWLVDGTAPALRVDDSIRMYERKRLTEQLAEAFDMVAK